MGVVTVGALDEPFFHAMVERHVELRLDLLVAGIAEIRLSFDQKVLIRHSVVRRMAIQAAYVVLAVGRTRKIHVVLARAVAFQATLVDLLGRRGFETENLFGIAGIIHVPSRRSVAAFAPLLGWTASLVDCGLPVRGFVEIVIDFLVTRLARFRTCVG